MSFISNNSAFRNGPLSNDGLRRLAPSIFASERHESRSEKYAYIPTIEIVEGMRENGFLPFFAKQGKSRVPGKAEFTKHLIRFRHAGAEGSLTVGGVYPEVVLVNSHDGTSAYKAMAGLFRVVCLNGMIAGDRELASVAIPHKGDVMSRVIEGSFEVLSESRKALGIADSWQGITLSRDEQYIMAESAHVLRFADSEGNVATPIAPAQLLHIRRRDDAGSDLWRTTNRIQENVIRGGLTAMGRDEHNRPRRTTTREVHGIDADVKLNKALWMLGERMAALKVAA
jgi:hypothetical protein